MGYSEKHNEAYPSPPAYTDHPAYSDAGSSSSSPSNSTAPSSIPAAGATIRFPQKFLLHAKCLSITSFIGPSKDQPMFAVHSPSKINYWTRKETVLRNGTDKLSAPLATVGPEKGSKMRHTLIRVAPKAGAPIEDFIKIRMPGDNRLTHELEIPMEDGTIERFEWRNTKGSEVRELSGGYNHGWKLVRLEGPYSMPGGQASFPQGYTSDGREIVAVGAYPRFFRKSPEFQFLGSGARGEMGEMFETVAVMGFIRLYELAMQAAASAAASNNSAAAAAAVA